MIAEEGMMPSRTNKPPLPERSFDPPAFTYVNISGRWQGPEGSERFTKVLQDMGHTVLNPVLPGWDTKKTVVDDAKVVLDACEGHYNIVFNAHSLGNKVLAHVLKKIDDGLVIAANMLADPGPDDFKTPGIERYVADYADGIEDKGNGTNIPYPDIRQEVYYTDISDAEYLQRIVAGNMPWRIEDAYNGPTPPMPNQKIIPLFSIRGLQDRRIHTLPRVMEVDKNWIRMPENPIKQTVRWLSGGHTLWASMPDRLAYIANENAQLSYVYRHKPTR